MRCRYDILVMWFHWHHQWHYCICLVKTSSWGATVALLLVSHTATGIKNGTIEFLRSRQLKWGATGHFGPLKPLALALVSHHVHSIINVTLHSLAKQLKWGATWLSCHWHQYWHYTMPLALVLISCDAITLVSPSCDANSTINKATAFL